MYSRIVHTHREKHTHAQSTMYAPSLSTTFCQRSRKQNIPRCQNSDGFESKNWVRYSAISSSLVNRLSRIEFCNDRNRWKSLGAKSGLYGGCAKTCHPSCRILAAVSRAICGLALSCRRIVGPVSSSFLWTDILDCSRSNCWQYTAAVMVVLGGRSSQWSIPWLFHQHESCLLYTSPSPRD